MGKLPESLRQYRVFAPAILAHFTLKKQEILATLDQWQAKVRAHPRSATIHHTAHSRMGYGAGGLDWRLARFLSVH